MKKWIRKKVSSWLGIDQINSKVNASLMRLERIEDRVAKATHAAADVHFRGNTKLVIISELKGGTVQIFDLHLNNPSEIHNLALHILGPAWPEAVIDAPPDFARYVRNFEKGRHTYVR